MCVNSRYLFIFILTITGIIHSQWVEIWSDEFEYTGLPDTSKWGYEQGYIRNNEKQYYTVKREKNVRVENGTLVLEAHKEDYEGMGYTSASIYTSGKGDWKYGRVEVRADLPEGTGIWPAIWMLPTHNTYGTWPASGEIDIMEYVGYQPDIIHGTIHTDAYNHKKGSQRGKTITVTDCENAFHVYAMEWDSNRIDIFVDDTKYFTFKNDRKGDYTTWPFDQPFNLKLNIAVGGSWGGAEGIDDKIFPQQLVIDYVKVLKPDTINVSCTDLSQAWMKRNVHTTRFAVPIFTVDITGDGIKIVSLHTQSEITAIYLIDIRGRRIQFAQKPIEPETIIDLSGVTRGVYILNVKTDDNIFTEKLSVYE